MSLHWLQGMPFWASWLCYVMLVPSGTVFGILDPAAVAVARPTPNVCISGSTISEFQNKLALECTQIGSEQ
jgi:hypothetical protein